MTLPIRRVTVHRDGALVVRRGTVTAADGIARVRGLPLLLDEGSVRTAVTDARVGGVRLQLDLEGLDRADRTEAIEALAEATLALAVLRAECGALTNQRKWLVKAVPCLDEEEAPPVPDRLLQWAHLGEKIEPWARELDEALFALNEKIRLATERVTECEHKVHWESSETWWQRWAPTRVAVLEVGADGDIEVELSYRIQGATWTPAYTLEADGPLKKGRFTMRALVVQATGEDWNDVALSLSTAPCARRIELPELPALRLGARQPSKPSAWRSLPADLDSLFPDDLAMPDPFAIDGLRSQDGDDRTEQESTTVEFFAADIQPQCAPAAPQYMDAPRSGGLLRLPSLPSFGSRTSSAPPEQRMAPKKRPAPPPALMPSRQDYPSFRLANWTHPPDRRGRLHPIDDGALIAESGLPPAASRHMGQSLGRLTTACTAVEDTKLPPHHVLPGPVEGVDFRFDTDAAADVPADGRFHSVAVFAEPVALHARYRTVPHADARAFRIVDARIERSMPLLPGPVDVFVAGDLVLTAAWGGTPGRGNIELGLGVEDALQIARNVRYDEQSTGLFGGGRRLDTSIEVTVTSSLAREVRLEILSRVPVSDDDDVQVEDLSSEPKAHPWEGETDGPILKGGRRQTVKVPPGGEVVTTLAYGVRLGAKEELVGGDRRA